MEYSSLQSLLSVEWLKGSLFLVDPKIQMAEFPLDLGSLIGGTDSHSSQPTCPAQSSDGTAEVKFSEDRAPVMILFSQVTVPGGSKDVDPALKASLHFSPWD